MKSSPNAQPDRIKCNDLDLTWDQDLNRSFASEKDDDPDLILDHDLKPGLASSLPPLVLLCQMTVAIKLPIFVFVRSASRNGIIIEMLPAYIARRIQPISSGSQIS
jgi:hypothetical protein